MSAKQDVGKNLARARPTELTIVVILEAFAGLRYLLGVIAYSPTETIWTLNLALVLISFLLAYGLWRIARWAWIISLSLSILGVLSTFSILFANVELGTIFIHYLPSIILDAIVIVILLSKNIKSLFWGTRGGTASLPSDPTPPQNP